jgi:NAD(P)H-hydrate epimerase
MTTQPLSSLANHSALLTAKEMREADRLTIKGGVPSLSLMEAAGRAIAEAITEGRDPGKALVLAGGGNNGGDGFVAARYLRKAGWRVSVASLKDVNELRGDAAEMAQTWNGSVRWAKPDALAGYDVIVDALFGTGLKGALEGEVAAIVAAGSILIPEKLWGLRLWPMKLLPFSGPSLGIC